VKDLQKMGGLAALINAAAYLVGIGLVLAFLAPIMAAPPKQYLAFLAGNQTLMILWHVLIYLVAGVAMVPLALALHERLKDGAPALMQTTTAIGLIWAGTVISSGMIIIHNLDVIAKLYSNDPAQATTAWIALSAVGEGLGGAIELPGGLWVLLVSWAGLRTGRLPRALSYFGVVIGAAGIGTVLPYFYNLGSVFGIGDIVWFLAVGIVLLRGASSAAPRQLDAFVPHHTAS